KTIATPPTAAAVTHGSLEAEDLRLRGTAGSALLSARSKRNASAAPWSTTFLAVGLEAVGLEAASTLATAGGGRRAGWMCPGAATGLDVDGPGAVGLAAGGGGLSVTASFGPAGCSFEGGGGEGAGTGLGAMAGEFNTGI